MALLTASGQTAGVLCGSAASLDNLAAGTFLCWVYPTDVANSARELIGKYGAGLGMGWELLRRSADGTSLRLMKYDTSGSTYAISVVSPTGVLVANTWLFIGTTWDHAQPLTSKIYRGSLRESVTTLASTVTSSGNPMANDSAGLLALMNFANTTVLGNTSWAGSMAWAGLWNRVLTLREIRSQQFNMRVTSGCVGFWHLGLAGGAVTLQPDLSGRGNHGTVTSATQAPHVPIIPPYSAASAPWWAQEVTSTGRSRLPLMGIG